MKSSDKSITKKKEASPSARKLAKKKINLEKIKGSGIRGTILKEDLINLMGPNLHQTKEE